VTLDKNNNALMLQIFEVLNSESGGDQMRLLLESLLNVTMKLEREKALDAEPYERTDQRTGMPMDLNQKPSILEWKR